MLHIEPLNDNVLVRRAKAEDRSKGGILLPDAAKNKPQKGTVLATGPGRVRDGEREPTGVKKGDVILFSPYAGNEVKELSVDGEEMLLVVASDILAIVTDMP